MDIGNMVAKGRGRLEWMISEFSTLPRQYGDYYRSPTFYADGDEWFLQIHPNGTRGYTGIRFTLACLATRRNHLTFIVGVKRADHSEHMIGTETWDGILYPFWDFNKTRTELKNGGWLLHGRQLTVTLLFGEAYASYALQALALGQCPVCLTTHTDVPGAKMVKNERFEDCTCTGAKGARRLIENVKGLLTEENEDYDVRILVKGKEFRAHRLILKARSPVLSMMLTHDSRKKKSGTIHIEDCDPECFDAFLLFVYSGRTENLTTSKALSLYHAADKYDLPDLKEQCAHFLEESLSATSVCDVVQLATRHKDKELLRTATEFFAENFHEVLPTAEWRSFMRNYSDQANELNKNAFVYSLRK